MYPPCVPQFAHSRIDDGITRSPARPCPQRLRVHKPRKRPKLRPQWLILRSRKVKQHVVRELAPDDLAKVMLGTRRSALMPDLSRADLAEVQVRRYAGGSTLIG